MGSIDGYVFTTYGSNPLRICYCVHKDMYVDAADADTA